MPKSYRVRKISQTIESLELDYSDFFKLIAHSSKKN